MPESGFLPRLLLRAYPAAFRRAHGDEILAFLAAERRHRRFTMPILGPMRFWWWACIDTLRSGIRVRRSEASAARFGLRRRVSVGGVAREIRYAMRRLCLSPGFTLAAMVTLALGIGASAAAFSVVNAVLLRPLPLYEDPDNIVYLFSSGLDSSNLDQYASEFDMFSSMAAHGFTSAFMRGSDDEMSRVSMMPTTGNFFPILGIAPAVGRTLSPADDRVSASAVAVITDRLARRRFGGAEDAPGEVLTLDDVGFEIVGVLPPGYQYEVFGGVDVWISQAHWPESGRRIIARLATGVSRAEALAQVELMARRIEFPEEPGRVRVSSLHERVVIFSRRALWNLAAMVGLLLLIACANVANLMLARNAARQAELAVRVALGASRARLVAEVLAEGVVLAAGATLLAWLPAGWITSFLLSVQPGRLPRADGVAMDVAVMTFSLLVALASVVLFGLAPALTLPAKQHGIQRAVAARETGGRLRRSLIIAEVAIATLLLVGTALLMRTFLVLLPVQPGFEWRDRLAFRVELPARGYDQPEQRAAFFAELVERLAGVSGVDAVAATSDLPMTRSSESFAVTAPGPGDRRVHPRSVSVDYLQLMDMPIVSGRGFGAADFAPAGTAAVVNQSLSMLFWPGEDPLGRSFRVPVAEGRETELTVVGVVADAWMSPGRAEARPEVFVPFTREPTDGMALVMSGTNLLAVAPTAVQVARDLDPGVAIIGPNRRADAPRLMAEVLGDAIAPWRYQLAIAGVFSALAVSLTAVGLYGVLAFAVGTRAREVGIRLAVGARPAEVVFLIMKHGMSQVGAGIVIGILAAIAASRLLASFLYGVSPLDPISYAACAVSIVVVGAVACWLPSRSAAGVDPVRVLRGN